MAHTIQNRRLVPIDDALRELGGIGRTTLYRLIADGHVTRVHVGRRAFITDESISSYLETITAAC